MYRVKHLLVEILLDDVMSKYLLAKAKLRSPWVTCICWVVATVSVLREGQFHREIGSLLLWGWWTHRDVLPHFLIQVPLLFLHQKSTESWIVLPVKCPLAEGAYHPADQQGSFLAWSKPLRGLWRWVTQQDTISMRLLLLPKVLLLTEAMASGSQSSLNLHKPSSCGWAITTLEVSWYLQSYALCHDRCRVG